MSGSLAFRVFGGYGLVILLTLGVAGIVFFSLLGGYQQTLDRNSLRQLSGQVLFGVTQFAEQGASPQEIARYLETQSEETGALVFILDAGGRVVQDLSPGAEFNQLQLPITLRDVRNAPGALVEGEFAANGQDTPFLARLIPIGRFGRGAFVAVALPEAGTAGVVGDLIPRLLVSGLAGLVVASVVGFAVTRSIYNPLQRLTGAVRAVGRGRYDTRVAEEGPEETKELARAFNRMTEQVQANETMLQGFIADVSHELRTPLTSIRGFTQALMDGTVQDEAARQRSAKIIDDEARRLLRLVEELLDLARMQAGSSPLQRELVDPAELVTHVVDVFSQRAADAGLVLKAEVVPPLPPLSCDFDRLVQVLTNLVGNAMRHTRQGGITLGAAPENGSVVLTVRDTGEGIAAADLEHLFDRFYRGGQTGRRLGTGLGLAISREIVHAHGGTITAESELGMGTSFRITLPAAEGEPARTT